MSARLHVALATSLDWPSLPPEDAPLLDALRAAGCEVTIAVWTDGGIAWDAFDRVVVRSCWDYHRDLDRWLAWIDRLAALHRPDTRGADRGEDVNRRVRTTRLLNPPAVLRWNARKTYLRELEARGIATIPTLWFDPTAFPGAELWPALEARLHRLPGDEWVVKPAVSAGARATFRVSRAALDRGYAPPRMAILEKESDLRRCGPLMLQPLVTAVADAGEWSLIYLGGTFSHAVVKHPAAGDFRVQAQHGGSTRSASPPATLRDTAADVLRAATAALADGGPSPVAVVPDWNGTPFAYARVDLIVDGDMARLVELEVTEPGLFLTAADEPVAAAGRLVAAIAADEP